MKSILRSLPPAVSSAVVLGILAVPLATILILALTGDLSGLERLLGNVLPTYAGNSLKLVAGTVVLAVLFGVPPAWVVVRYEFPTRRVLQWLLCLPLAMPAYLTAYLYTDLLDYAGPLQGLLRAVFGWHSAADYWFPHIRTLEGACFVLAVCLYPYVFLMVRLAFLDLNRNMLDSARMLGRAPGEVFRLVTLPLVRPALVVGCSLVAMETLGDFGTVYFFAVNTLTTGVYDSWLSLGDVHAAAQLSLSIMGFVALLVAMERLGRRRQRRHQRSGGAPVPRLPIHGALPRTLVAWAWVLVVLGFLYPAGQLLFWSVTYFEQVQTHRFLEYVLNSLELAGLTAIVCVGVSLVLHWHARLTPGAVTKAPLIVGPLGYAVPGTVLALGLLIPLSKGDHLINEAAASLGLAEPGLLMTSGVFTLVVALSIRFIAMPIGSLETALGSIPPSLEMASRTLGMNSWRTWLRVHMPLVRRGVFTALLFVFVESMKELNASLLLRPFGFETLVTHVYAYTSDEQLEKAALPALVLILTGLIPVVFLTYSMLREGRSGPSVSKEGS